MRRLWLVPLMTLYLGLISGIPLFWAAGRFDLPFFWGYTGIFALTGGVFALVIHPGLIHERFFPGPGGRDYLARALAFPLLLSHLVVAGLDVGRFHWSDTVPFPLQLAGIPLLLVSMAVTVWAYAANPFYSSVVRVQTERGHYVVTTGPYRYLRHPGYFAGLLLALGSSLVLGSWLSYLPMLLMAVVTLRRTWLEDRFLMANLPGYTAYTRHVRYRLIPGLW